jgi:hypothetical protein
MGFRGLAPLVSEKRNSFFRLLKNKAFKKERRTKNGVYAIGECTTLESNKSLVADNQQLSGHLAGTVSGVSSGCSQGM